MDLSINLTISQIMPLIIRRINDLSPQLSLKYDIKRYNIYFTKKTGEAKDDLPGIVFPQ